MNMQQVCVYLPLLQVHPITAPTHPGCSRGHARVMLLVPQHGAGCWDGEREGESTRTVWLGGEARAEAKPKAWLRGGVQAFNPACVSAPDLQFRETS